MFKYINSLFLLALAFIAWTVCCYFHEIEEQLGTQGFDVELYSEHPALKYSQLPCKNIPKAVPQTFPTVELIFSSFIVLCLTYTWVKLSTFLVERTGQFWQAMKPEEEDRQVKEQLMERLNSLKAEFQMMSELLKQHQPSVDLELQTMSTLELQSHSGCSSLELQKCDSGCSEVHQLPSSSSCSNHCSNDVPINELCNQKNDVCSIRGTPRLPDVPTVDQDTESNYICTSQIPIGPNMFNTKPLNLELIRQSRLFARKPSVFLQVSDNFIAGPRDRPRIGGSSCTIALPPPNM
ncbi:uncharacterized protein [Drosophila pseudoobscura]|uniref:Uncharacterized protein n=1 Tax=Drosophila pseudoobscura pseudoobscura TaxID=46245 RepID=A0A6I8V4I4_DROPS|nr:uncharacterized protein LOC6898618 [Drosophila pseudoobscura]